MSLNSIIRSKKGEEDASFPPVLAIIFAFILFLFVVAGVYYIVKFVGGS